MSFRELVRQHPFLRILIPLLVGILVFENFRCNKWLIQTLIFVGFAGLLLFYAIPFLRKSFSYRMLFGVFATTFFLGLGGFRLEHVQNEMLLIEKDSIQYYEIKLLENPVEKTNSFACFARIEKARQPDISIPETAKVLIYFQKDSLAKNLESGNRLLINSKFNRVKNAGNPNEFDYAFYLKTQHILYSTYLKSYSWVQLPVPKEFDLRRLAGSWRDQLLQIYREKGIKDESFDILAALTLGYKANIDPEVKKAWGNAGALHVLAVSGLHVGIIYMVMNFIFGFLGRYKFGRWGQGGILLCSLWLYALITGMSPSVMRAACMFSFIVFGKILKRKGGVFNSLAASAVFLLLFNPYLLFTVGFQFSYLAVAGIVFFQPRFDKLIYIGNPILKKFWQLTTVAISAQIATFPLTIFYFNQFPTYFLLSGYVVILMAGILIYTAALLLIFSRIGWLANGLAWALHNSVKLMNQVILWIQDLPGAIITGCCLTSYQVVLLFLLILSLVFVLVLKRKRTVFTFLILLIAYKVPEIYYSFQSGQKEIVVFNAGKNSLIAFRDTESVYFLCDKSLGHTKFERLTKNYLLANNVRNFNVDTLKSIDYRKFYYKHILILGKNYTNTNQLLDSLQADLVILRKSSLKADRILTKNMVKGIVVLDASVYNSNLKNMSAIADAVKSNFHIVRSSGAFICDLSSTEQTSHAKPEHSNEPFDF